MRKFLSLFMIALMFCAVVSVGCGGGGSDYDSVDPEQTESLNENTGGDDSTHSNFEGGRGTNENYVTLELRRNEAFNYYAFKHFYGRKSSGNWVNLVSWETYAAGSRLSRAHDIPASYSFNVFDCTLQIPKDYVEFGFEFDQKDGTSWPYSNVFWTADDSKNEQARNIRIDTGGALRTAYIYIKVNDHVIINENCSSHTRYDWSNGPGLSAPNKLNVLQRGAFATSDMNFYGRKAGGKWEKLYSFGNSGDEKAIPDGYVDFGFEFNIGGALDDGDVWPYSWPFWIAEEHPDCNVKSISITVGGWWWFFGSPHIDITVQGYDANGIYNKLYSYSNHELDYKDKSPNKGKQYSW